MRYGSDDELDSNRTMVTLQLAAIPWLLGTGIFVWLVGIVSPGFFHHPNLTWSVSPTTISRFWPLFVYGAFLAIVTAVGLVSSRDDGRNLVMGIVKSILAGTWEEIGFRWLFICTAMVGIALMNWAFGTGLGFVIVIACFLLGCYLAYGGIVERDLTDFVFGLLGFALSAGIAYVIWYLGLKDPVYWTYQTIIIPIINVVTFGKFTDVTMSTAVPRLFVYGMISANAKFREGHKYQGPFGVLNSWILGFIMMHATLAYGIGTAIVVHIIYDLEFAVLRFLRKKVAG